jgi:hypothetical protein
VISVKHFIEVGFKHLHLLYMNCLRKKMEPQRFAFIVSAIKITEAKLPFEVASKYWIDKATDSQIQKIKSFFERNARPLYASPYELDISVAPGKPMQKCLELSKDDLRYYVINFDDNSAELSLIQQACLLTENEIYLGFVILEEPLSGLFNPHKLDRFLNEFDPEERIAKQISKVDLELISDFYTRLKNLSTDYQHVLRASLRFEELSIIPKHSDLHIIGIFSIIETLLTHAPKSSDSLTHQIQAKFPLVRKRFQRSFDYQQYFSQMEESKLWSKLYSYRSKIVHGEDAKVEGELQPLRDKKTIVKFLREAAKLLLIASLYEPILMLDLKKC